MHPTPAISCRLEDLRQTTKLPMVGTMLFAETPFTSTILPIPVTRLGAHPNVVMAVLVGRAGPITVEHAGVSVTGDVLLVRGSCTAFGSRGEVLMLSTSTD